MDEQTLEHLSKARVQLDRQMEIAEGLKKKDPKLSDIAAIIIAGDMLGAERAQAMLDEGKPFDEVAPFLGSFVRLDFWYKAWMSGKVQYRTLLEQLPHLWSGSDPDDTDPKWLLLWRDALALVGNGHYIRDEKPLPDINNPVPYTVFRGQDEGAPTGIAWTLDKKVAAKFANGAATRQANRGGVIYQAMIPRKKVIAYLTGRGESEIILNPMDLITKS